MSERRDERVSAYTGQVLTVTNGEPIPQAVTIDCGDYGTIMFNACLSG